MPYDFTQQDDIHTRQKIPPQRDIFLVLVLLFVVLLEYFALVFFLNNQLKQAFFFHAVSFVLMLIVALSESRRGKDARFAWIAVIALPIVGPVAPGGVLLSLFWHCISKEKSLTFMEWRESIFPTEHQSLAQIVYERITFGRDQLGENYSITYLMDVIKMGNDEKKREAIFKISRYYDPSFAPLLRMALEDQHNAIRVQAAAAITKLKNEFFSQSVKLVKLKREWPEKPGLFLDLARHYDNYAFSGLLDETQEGENRLLALYYYRQFLDQEPENSPRFSEVRQLLGRLLLRMNMIEDACWQFECLKKEGHATPDINLWYGECLFYLRRYSELRALAIENNNTPLTTDDFKYPYQVRGTILLWAGVQEQGRL